MELDGVAIDIPFNATPWRAGFHPGQRCFRLARDVEMELDIPFQRYTMEGRVPSRPAVFPVGT